MADNFLTKSGISQVLPPHTANQYFQIHGETSQVVHINLAPDQKVQCEPGTMVYCSNEVKANVKLAGFARILVDGSFFKDIYHNKGNEPGYVGFTANFPGTIIPINLDENGGSIACMHESFLAAMDPNCQIKMTQLNTASTLACCCAGMPFFMENIVGKGWVFLAAHGTIIEKQLSPGEELVVDTNSVVAVSNSVSVDVRRTGGCMTCCFGGEGLFNTSLKGPGRVIMSSMPLGKIRQLFTQPPPKKNKPNAGGVQA